MSEYLMIVILGIVQGITEFLPISSDGHLEIAKYILGDKSTGMDSLELTVLLHIATTLSICYVFREKIVSIIRGLMMRDASSWRLAMLVVISMVPAAIVGLFFEEEVSSLFEGRIMLVALCLFINGLILYVGNKALVTNQPINEWRSLLMGIAQMFAILPGISRSGSTISVAALSNVNRYEAAEFSFIMVLPLIFGKIGKDVLNGGFAHLQYSSGALLAGFAAAFVVGIFAFRLLLRMVAGIRLHIFAYYCMTAGILIAVYGFWRGL
ncbi:MAG: undecaprenyl-diphosphate phosphatase [Saprospiraceae bacterium]|nr:undecaprenyl-diphosphate phosphatase [Saprospiraceae bacterium]HMW38866.1 undecaprenyl-diphosphate phosphatase [Saprospiraceae bacterium]HMX87859.1 undecaprenyl-diphosphate phosphatase [Saprospiraceae bacterium]HMZ39707.1 undecaprenyl-diphosphate phosphatase [Saprospiraceae bacterium]HNA64272.1 undecaprenyl-diphosphate phosphatase [Saprospiraceae bacterium]